MLLHLPGSHDAASTRAALTRTISTLVMVRNLATGVDQGCYAAVWYSLISPPRMRLRRIRSVHSRRTVRAREPLSDGVHLRCLRRGHDRGDASRTEHRVERGGELGVAVPDGVGEAASRGFEVRGECGLPYSAYVS
jgi:hypothetical protein